MSAANVSLRAVVLDDDAGDRGARAVGLERDRLGVRQQRHVGVLERRPDRDHLGVGLGVHEAREAVAVGAADALAVRHVGLVEQDPAGRVERVQAGLSRGRRRAAGSAARARPPGTGRARSRAARSDPRRARRGPGRAARPACSTAPSGRRRSATPARSRRGGAARRSPRLAQAVQRGPVELGRAADVVVHLRLERRAVRVVPGVGRDVAAVDEHVLRQPVLRLPRQPAAALEQQDPLARRGQAADQRAAAGAAADHDHVV